MASKETTYTCACEYCGKTIKVKYPAFVDPGDAEACIGVVCNDCFKKEQEKNELPEP
jgi:hypothetical protein